MDSFLGQHNPSNYFALTDKDHFTVNVDVHVSRQFLGWIISLGNGIRILGPATVVDSMNAEIDRLAAQYK